MPNDTPSAVEVALGRFLWRVLHDGVGLNGDDHLATINDVVTRQLTAHTDIGEAWREYQSALAALATPGMPKPAKKYKKGWVLLENAETDPAMRQFIKQDEAVWAGHYDALRTHATELAALCVAKDAELERYKALVLTLEMPDAE